MSLTCICKDSILFFPQVQGYQEALSLLTLKPLANSSGEIPRNKEIFRCHLFPSDHSQRKLTIKRIISGPIRSIPVSTKVITTKETNTKDNRRKIDGSKRPSLTSRSLRRSMLTYQRRNKCKVSRPRLRPFWTNSSLMVIT